METIKLKKSAWHYKLLTWEWNTRRFTGSVSDYKLDICGYRQKVIKAIAGHLFMFGVLTTALASVLDTIIWITVCIMTRTIVEPHGIAAFTFIAAALAIILGVYASVITIKKRFWPATNQDSFIKQAYLSFKDKYCLKVEFED